MEKSLRIAYVVISLLMVAAGIGTVIAVVTAPGTVSGRTGVGLQASVDPPFRVTRAGVSAVESPHLTVSARIPKGDRDSRVVIVTSLLVAIALWWAALIALRRIVSTARDGNPFDRRNVGRLRLLASLLLAAPVVVGVANRMLEGTFDSTVVHPHVADVNAATMVVIALGVFVLSEVFRKGAELQELEESTV